MINNENLDFTRRISYIRDKFQDSTFLSFKDCKEKGVDYFNQFSTTLGSGPGMEISSKKANKSISGRKMELLRTIN